MSGHDLNQRIEHVAKALDRDGDLRGNALRKQACILVISLFVLCVPTVAKDTKAEGRIGDLLITATGMEETDTYEGRPAKPGFHDVLITIAIRNVGKDAVCTSLKATLDSTYGLETKGFPHFKDKRSEFGHLGYINQLLPGETVGSEFEFPDIRDGTQPVKLHIQPTHDLNQGCGKQRLISPYRANELTIKVANLPKL